MACGVAGVGVGPQRLDLQNIETYHLVIKHGFVKIPFFYEGFIWENAL